MKIKTKKTIFSIIGYLTITFSISLMIKANAGKLLYTTFLLSLYDLIQMTLNLSWWTIGKTMISADLVILIILLVLYKKRTNISFFYPVILAFAFGLMVDFWIWAIPIPMDLEPIFPFWIRTIMLVFGVFLASAGIAMSVTAKQITAPLDLAYIAIADLTKTTVDKVVVGFGIFFIFFAILIMFYTKNWSHITIVGVTCSFVLGWFIRLWLPLMEKLLNSFIK